tara:strand:- start:5 stop:766 length:762 start_codon:yes stop_codon:yes gene_type:complete
MKINPNHKITFIENPYPVWVIDNLLDGNLVDEIKKDWPDKDSPLWHSGYKEVNGKKNILEERMLAISDLEKMPENIGDLVRFFHNEEFLNNIKDITGIQDIEADKSMRWSGMRTMLPESYQLIHSDARKHPENKLRKELTLLFYFNKKDCCKERDQGCLEIWDDSMKEAKHELEPLNNRLVIFVNSDTSYHGVPTVKSERRAITFSYLKNGEATERNKALFVGRPQDPKEVTKIGKERAFLKDKQKPKGLVNQ